MKVDPSRVLSGVRGYAAIFDVEIPRFGMAQKIRSGAFSQWESWIPIIYSHKINDIPDGVVYHLEEDSVGLYFEGMLFDGVWGRQLQDRIEQRVVDGVSFSAMIDRYEIDENEEIMYVEAFSQGIEISPTIIPAMAQTTIKTFDLTGDQISAIVAEKAR